MKSGIFTSEFWMSLGGFAAGLALIVVGAVQHDRDLLEWGVVVLLGGSVPYVGGRVFVKAKAQRGLSSDMHERASDVMGRMLDVAEKHLETLTKAPEAALPAVRLNIAPACSMYCGPDADSDGPCVYCGQVRFGHLGVAQVGEPANQPAPCKDFIADPVDGRCVTCNQPKLAHRKNLTSDPTIENIRRSPVTFAAIMKDFTDDEFDAFIEAAKFDRKMRANPEPA